VKYIDEFRNKNLIKKASRKIEESAPAQSIKIMEVCGTHTQSFFRFGLDRLLPKQIRLIAGPGCPVCVSSQGYIDNCLRLAQDKDVIILTFGDMLRVPGSRSTLEKERARFGNVQVLYSPAQALKIAQRHPKKKVVFLAVGFETTAPTIALTIIAAKKKRLKNLFFYSSLKLIPPAMDYLLQDERLNLDGFLCPGHVSAIIGTKSYEFIPKRYKIGCCVAGFEPLDILEGIYILLKQILKRQSKVENQYMRVVTKNGNSRAQKIIKRVFKTTDASWRGLGEIPGSGLKIRDEFSKLDAEKFFSLHWSRATSHGPRKRCKCGDVLKGLIRPNQCPLFKVICRPDNPIGPCMVSSEGACSAYYKYR